jgi:hypothetical protein
MLLTLKEPEIRLAIVSYISGILGTKPETLDADAITLTAGRGTNGFTAEVDVQLVAGLVSASTPTPTEVVKPASKPTPVKEEEPEPEIAKEVQEEEPPFEDAESIPKEEATIPTTDPEPEQEEVITPRRRNPLFAKPKKDAE